MTKIQNKILDLIIKNKISSTEVADALGKSGVLKGIMPLNDGHFASGLVEYICTFNNSNWELHKQIENIVENRIVFIDAYKCDNRALFGDIVSKYIMYYKNSNAIVVNGLVRDVHQLKKANYPIFAKGRTPIGCFNKEVDMEQDAKEYYQDRKNEFQDSIIICDDTGCVLIKKEQQTKELYEKLQAMEIQEDIWYFCVDTLKWSTFKTICKKDYFNNEVLLAEEINKKKSKLRGLLK